MRKLAYLAITLFFGQLAASLVFGLEITVPAETPEHSLVSFTCDAPQAGVRWIVRGPRGSEPVYLAGTGGVFTGPPGAYTVLLEATVDGKPMRTWAETVIKEGENGPDPPQPDPKPDPKPDPPPKPGIKQVTVIYEQRTWTAKQAAVAADLTWRTWLTSQGHPEPLVKDQDAKAPDGSPSPSIAELLPHVKGKLPVLFSVSADGSYEQTPLPKTAQGIIDFIQKWGG